MDAGGVATVHIIRSNDDRKATAAKRGCHALLNSLLLQISSWIVFFYYFS